MADTSQVIFYTKKRRINLFFNALNKGQWAKQNQFVKCRLSLLCHHSGFITFLLVYKKLFPYG